MKKNYEQPENSVDLLVLGSSHAYMDINPAVLFSEYGIAAFVLAGPIQPLWNTYFYLCETLKSQKPKVVLLEAYCTIFDGEYNDEGLIVQNTYGMKLSRQYLEAVRVSAPKEEFWDYFLRYTRYHRRYTGISRADFFPTRLPMEDANWINHLKSGNNWADWKGFVNITGYNPFSRPDVAGTTARTALSQKTELYYRKIIELCDNKNIPLEILVVPYVVPAGDQLVFNTASDIAAEYGVSFTNYNNKYDEIGFDFDVDMIDTQHANQRGSIKITNYLGKQLAEKYNFTDRRNDPRYASWQRNADYFWQSIDNQRLKKHSDFDTYFEKINSDPHYTLLLQSTGEQGMDILNRFAVVEEITDLITIKQGEILSYVNAASPRPFIQLGSVMVSLDRANNTLINGNVAAKNQNGLNLLVYDALTDTIADNVTFDVNNNFAVVHQ